MVADWIVIYAVLFVLAAGVVGRVPVEVERPRQGGCPGSPPIDLSPAVPLCHGAVG